MNKRLIYLDNNATTPTDPRVVDAMLPYFYEKPGNPASRNHPFGWVAEEAVDYAREQIADLIHVDSKEIIFTSGATEADNLALKGVFEMYHSKGNHIITTKTEHKAVLDSCKKIEKMGGEVTYLDVHNDGRIDLDALDKAIKKETILVSIMWANNETGVIQDMKAIGDICKKHGVLLMSDATQAVGKIDVDPKAVGVHLMAFSSHKMYGPKGVGALYVCRKNPRVKVTAQMDGGGHERGMRSGTLNVPGIVGFGKAAKLAKEEMDADAARLSGLRDQLQSRLIENLEEVYVNGDQNHRMPHVTNISFKHVEGEGLMMTFNQEIAVSSGSACTSASLEPSYVLVALGLGDDLAHSSIRFSLGRFTTQEDIDYAVEALTEGVKHMRDLSPIWEMYKEGIDLNNMVWDNSH
ncbi:MAG: IscS subfamily cysteine desulfurase [Saprospiraceae bacterium]|mgnify:FL=1|jgi:cysteine desulfurase|nr:IscS subfamily cysteine desulfurase [Saprospiraceae bacterium]MCA0332472.1 IscS subfamily cysteine desulfurase [Bacteroidota bacterium]MCB0604763.1 IscS subfamily cysteine desulfurase [Saprospiraceae bacterium]MCO5276884.1 IscS subfamily cysteine desulfurase [Saprospiraceae bacterium]HMT76859.1 IscS subfamily cysteine desulfurase [Saprospiraceae bacterium]